MRMIRTVVIVRLPIGRNRFAEEEMLRKVVDEDGMPDFGILQPMPREIAEAEDGAFHFDFTMEESPRWRYDNWGCNDNGENLRVDDDAPAFVFSLDTIYKPPLEWARAFSEWVAARFPNAETNGVWVPNAFGVTEFGEFRCVDGRFETVELVDWDEPLMVKMVWEFSDEELLAYRGFIEAEPAPEEETEELSAPEEEPPTPKPSEGVPEAEGEPPWIIAEKPISDYRKSLKRFVRNWTRNW